MANLQTRKKQTYSASTNTSGKNLITRYNPTAVYGWQAQNTSAYNLISDYYERINRGDWISPEEREQYKNAINEYTLSGNKLRDVSKFYGTTYTDEDERSWQNSLSSLNKGYEDINKFYGQFADADQYNSWNTYGNWQRWNDEVMSADRDAYNNYIQVGKNVSNPTWREANKFNQQKVNNMVTFAQANIGRDFAAAAEDLLGLSFNEHADEVQLINSSMTGAEKNRYNYYIGIGDTKSAQEYLDYLMPQLEKRYWGDFYDFVNDKPVLEPLTNFTSGVLSGVQGIGNFVSGIVGGGEGISASGIQNVSGQMMANNTGFEKFANEAIYSVGNMMPTMAIGGYGGKVASALGASATTAQMFGQIAGSIYTSMSSAGNSYVEMLEQGYGKDAARTYGLITGITEGALQYAIGGIESIGGRLTNHLVKNAIDGIDNGIARFVANVSINMGSEALEEGIQTALEPVYKSIATGEEYEPAKWSDITYSALLGAVTSGVLDGVPRAFATGVGIHQAGKQYGADAGGIVAEALNVNPNSKVAQNAQTRIDAGKAVTGTQIYSMLQNIEQGYSKQTTSTIKGAVESKLTEMGETKTSKIADAITKQIMGEDLSLSEKNLIKNNANANQVLNSDINTLVQEYKAKQPSTQSPTQSSTQPTQTASTQSKSGGVVTVKGSDGNVVEAKISGVEVNGDKATLTLTNNEKVSFDKVSFSSEDAKTVAEIAIDRVSQGVSTEVATAMINGYDGTISPSQYTIAFNKAYELGETNSPTSELRKIVTPGISQQVAFTAYELGKNSVLQTQVNSDIINTEQSSEVINENGEDIRLRNGSEWNGSANPDGQISTVEGSTRQVASRGRTGRIADSEAARLVNEGRKVRVADLGIPGGSKTQMVVRLDDVEETTSMKKARAKAEARGKTVRYFAGDNLHITDKSGNVIEVRGYIKGDYVYVRADHPYYTADQIMEHELGHDKVAKGEVDVNKVRERLEEIVGKDNVDAVAEAYIAAYKGSELTVDEIWEECICDSLGDINIFASDEALYELMNLMMPNIKQAVAETTTPNKTRGSPESEGKASREIDERKMRGSYYLTHHFSGFIDVDYTKLYVSDEELGVIAHSIKTGYGRLNSYRTFGGVYTTEAYYLFRYNTDDSITIINSYDLITETETIDIIEEEFNDSKRRKATAATLNEWLKIVRSAERGLTTDYSNDGRKTEGNTETDIVDGGKSDSNSKRNQRSNTQGVEHKVKYSREIDSVGNELTKEQAEYFKDSKVRDDEGNLKVMYHGSSESFTIFDKSQRNASSWYGEGFYFTENKSEAYFYGDKLFETYLNVENPYIPTADKILEDGTVEFAPSFIDDLKNRFSEIKSIKNPTAAQITDVLQSKKYDGIIIGENVVIFESNQAKNIDNKNPTSNPDIRFSREIDTAYLDAVKSGDMETAQKMVDEVANATMPDSKIRTEDGKLRIVYHGTNTGNFTVFNPDYIGMSSGDDGFFGMGFYFAYSKGEASYYGSSRVISAYLNLKNPFNFEKELQRYQGKRASSGYAPDAVALMNFADKFPKIAKNVKIGVIEKGSDTSKDITLVEFSKAFKDVIENKTFEYREVENEFGEKETVVITDAKTVEYEYDGKKHSYKDYGFQKRFWGTPNELDVAYEYLANSVYEYVDMIPRTRLILDNNREFTAALKDMRYDGAIQSEYGDEAVAFYPNQIKSADPVTYDDDGNVIPLSERFNSENNDIRFSRELEFTDYLDENATEDVSHEVKPISNRELLVNSLESTAQNEAEKEKLAEYKGRIEMLNAEEKKLEKLRKELDKSTYVRSIKYNGEKFYAKEFESMVLKQAQKDGINKEKIAFRTIRDTDKNGKPLDTGKYVAYVRGKEYMVGQKEFVSTKTKQSRAKLTDEIRATENRINLHDKVLFELEATKPLQDLLSRERASAYRMAAEKGREALHRNVEGRHKTAERNRIRDIAHELDTLLNKGTKKKNVKIGQQDVISKVLDVTDMLFATDDELILNGIKTQVTSAEQSVIDKYKKLYAEYHDTDNAVTEHKEERKAIRHEMDEIKKQFADVLERERQRISNLKASSAFDALIEEYKKLASSDKTYIRDTFDTDTLQMLEQLKEDVGDTTVSNMTLAQLQTIRKALTMMKKMVQNTNKLFKSAKNETIEALGSKAQREIEKHGHKDKLNKLQKSYASFDWNNLKPIYLLERTDSSVLQELGQAIFDAESDWATDMLEARAFWNKMEAKYNATKWNLEKSYTFTNATGQTYSLTLEQIMSVYAYSKRGKQAIDHLKTDGFVFDETTEVKGKGGLKYELNDKTAYKITEPNLIEIVNKLTPEQKSYVDDMQKYLSEVMGEKGNEVSRELYGIDLFGEENYFPIRSEGAYLERVRQQAKGETKIKNKGFTKETQKGARNAIVLSDFSKVWSEHVAEMSSYHTFTLPLEDFYRVYNYQTTSDENINKEGVIPALENAYGKAATKAIDDLLNDINGGARFDIREQFGKEMLRLYKVGKTMLSLSVVVQQPTSILRAQAMIDPKYFIGEKIGDTKRKELWNELKQYAPVAIIKEMGYFDVGMGRSSADWLTATDYQGWGKVKGFFTDSEYRAEVFSKPASKADELTWVTIWNAVKRETARNNPALNTSSETFLNMAGKRFEDIIRHTQVYDSTLSRSSYMRNKNVYAQMVTSFMAEPTTSINMREMAMRSKDKNRILRTTAAVYSATLLNALLVALPYAMRDDDEDETFLEKYITAFSTSFADNINPLTSLPFVKDIWSILQGYDVDRADMTLASDLINSFERFTMSCVNQEGLFDNLVSLIGDLSAFTGIPLDNIVRDVKSVINLAKTIEKDKERATTWNSLADALEKAFHDETPVWGWFPSENKGEKLYDALVAGDDKYVTRFRSTYKTEDDYYSAVRKSLRDNDPRMTEAAQAYLDGNYTLYNKIRDEIVAEGIFNKTLVTDALKAEINYLKRKAEEVEK